MTKAAADVKPDTTGIDIKSTKKPGKEIILLDFGTYFSILGRARDIMRSRSLKFLRSRSWFLKLSAPALALTEENLALSLALILKKVHFFANF
jgi:hypothetical protein